MNVQRPDRAISCIDAAKTLTAEGAAALVPNGAKIVMGLGIAQPPAILAALAARAEAGKVDSLAVYYLLSTSTARDSVLRRGLRNRITPVSLFHSATEREMNRLAAAEGFPSVSFIPTAFSQVPRLLTEQVRADALITTVSPMDDDGNFSLGTNCDYALSVARSASTVILEVNCNMPRTLGDCLINIADVTAVVKNDTPLLEVPDATLRAEDKAIGQIIAGLIDDGACLQMGIGAVPQAVCAALRGHRNLGIHTELLTPGLAALMRAGVADNSQKNLHPGKSIFTFAMGDRELYDFLDGNEALETYPVDYVNDPCVIAAWCRSMPPFRSTCTAPATRNASAPRNTARPAASSTSCAAPLPRGAGNR
ncbi:acetyl-CoA hydrolase/transferase family protein [Sphingomonas sp. TX0543]|uniref:acetyl-CoA hydrolase/transferase family protein n=1 Tax=Sphingomonas sp. TX0543 TaxID=3399682 RepID=UPI003AFAABA6